MAKTYDFRTTEIETGESENPFDFKIVTEDGYTHEPWTDGYAVGYKVTDPDGSVQYIYLNAASNEGCPFLYIGAAGDPDQDVPAHHYNLATEEES